MATLSMNQWILPNTPAEKWSAVAAQTGLTPLCCKVLCARGIDTPEKVEHYQNDPCEIEDPLCLADMERGAARIRRAVEEGERICVFGDYDADGITSTVLLYSYLDICGADVRWYIPSRESDGYGLSLSAVEALHRDGVQLIVTVDNGIACCREAERAAELGMDLVITDHHQPGAELPRACAVIDPYRRDCPSQFKCLAGVGVAFKLVCALEEQDPRVMLDEFAPLVAIGTVADVMPLKGENRLYVKEGLAALPYYDNPGLAALIARCTKGGEITAQTLAFTVVPRINAAGRMESAESAVKLLTCLDEGEAERWVDDLCEKNAQRQQVEGEIIEEIRQMQSQHPEYFGQRVIVLAGEGWHKGIVGIVSSRVVDRFAKPCILLVPDGEEAKGSGRSFGDFSLYEALESCADCLSRYGGHKLAAGLSLPVGRIDEFRERINDYARKTHPTMPLPALRIDAAADFGELTLENVLALEELGPYGHENPKPNFLLQGVQVEGVYPISDDRHVRLKLKKGGSTLFAVYFRVSSQEFKYAPGDRVDVVVTLDLYQYLGEQNISIKVKDIHPAGLSPAIYDEMALYQKIELGEPLDDGEFARAMLTREQVALCYKAALYFGPAVGDFVLFYNKMAGKPITYCQMMLALNVLAELGILTVKREKGKVLLLVNRGQKADLNASRILRELTAKRTAALCI